MSMRTRHIKEKYSWLKHLDFMVLDVLALFVSFTLAYLARFGSLGFLSDSGWRSVLTIELLLDLVLILFSNPFSGIFRRHGSEELLCTFRQAVYNFLLCAILLYILKIGGTYSRAVVLLTYGFYLVISLSLRLLWKDLLRSGKATSVATAEKSIFVLGCRADMPQLLRSINSGFFKEYAVKGICILDGAPGETVTARIDLTDTLGRVKETYETFTNSTGVDGIVDYILKNHIEELFVGTKPSELPPETYQALIDNGKSIHLSIRPMVGGIQTDNQFITTVGTYKALGLGVYSFTGKQMIYMAVKRFMDMVFGLIGLVALLPLMLIVKISFLINGDRKPIFYTQTRVGLNGQPFQLIKFRSMVWNAGDILAEMLKDPGYAKEWAENQKFEHDPRITKMGGFLRKTSLDEVPQFINVLKGDMSVIGPRPLVPGELEQHGGLQLYNQVKPGITGWWGCNGRSNTTYDERLELEYYYVKNCSLWMDALCVLKTIVVLLRRDGAK